MFVIICVERCLCVCVCGCVRKKKNQRVKIQMSKHIFIYHPLINCCWLLLAVVGCCWLLLAVVCVVWCGVLVCMWCANVTKEKNNQKYIACFQDNLSQCFKSLQSFKTITRAEENRRRFNRGFAVYCLTINLSFCFISSKNQKIYLDSNIHTYIIGDYNPLIRIMTQFPKPLILCVLILYMSG